MIQVVVVDLIVAAAAPNSEWSVCKPAAAPVILGYTIASLPVPLSTILIKSSNNAPIAVALPASPAVPGVCDTADCVPGVTVMFLPTVCIIPFRYP